MKSNLENRYFMLIWFYSAINKTNLFVLKFIFLFEFTNLQVILILKKTQNYVGLWVYLGFVKKIWVCLHFESIFKWNN